MKKKLLYIWEYPFLRMTYKNYFLGYLKKYFSIRIIDCSSIFHKDLKINNDIDIKSIFFYKQELKDRPETYAKWFIKIKEIMQDLLDKEQKYENIIDDIKSMPIFSPTREVLIEKTQ